MDVAGAAAAVAVAEVEARYGTRTWTVGWPRPVTVLLVAVLAVVVLDAYLLVLALR